MSPWMQQCSRYPLRRVPSRGVQRIFTTSVAASPRPDRCDRASTALTCAFASRPPRSRRRCAGRGAERGRRPCGDRSHRRSGSTAAPDAPTARPRRCGGSGGPASSAGAPSRLTTRLRAKISRPRAMACSSGTPERGQEGHEGELAHAEAADADGQDLGDQHGGVEREQDGDADLVDAEALGAGRGGQHQHELVDDADRDHGDGGPRGGGAAWSRRGAPRRGSAASPCGRRSGRRGGGGRR